MEKHLNNNWMFLKIFAKNYSKNYFKKQQKRQKHSGKVLLNNRCGLQFRRQLNS